MYINQRNGTLFVADAAHWLIVPMIAIVGLSLALTLLGLGIDRVFDPRVGARPAGEFESVSEGDDSTTSKGMV